MIVIVETSFGAEAFRFDQGRPDNQNSASLPQITEALQQAIDGVPKVSADTSRTDETDPAS